MQRVISRWSGALRDFLAGLMCLAFLAGNSAEARAQVTITEINPKQSTIHQDNPNGASGGRINGLASVARNNRIFYAASEWGGLYQSTDGGRTWIRLDGHLPTATWDVEVSPTDANRVISTSFYDGRVSSLAGINVSADGGRTWTRPATATPPASFCADEARRNEPSAFGISIDPARPQNVYVGTNCGLALSNDGGNTWRFVDPTPEDRAKDVWDVVVHHGGIIDVCGDDGHSRSTTGGRTWTTATGNKPLPTGTCSIAASPDESYVLFAAVGPMIFESDDGGESWATQFTNPSKGGRIPFVATNQRSGAGFDLWFGDVSLHRAGCTTPTPSRPGGNARCPATSQWVGGFTTAAGAHDDMGDIAFDPQALNDPCPAIMSSDGGIYFNTVAGAPGCHTPKWSQPDASPRALWLFGLAGAARAGAAEDSLYFSNQDTGTFTTSEAGSDVPNWSTKDCCDSFDVLADSSRVVYTLCCYSPGRMNHLFIRGPGMTGGGRLNKYPPGQLPPWGYVGVVDQFGPADYALVTERGLFITRDITANPVNWVQLKSETANPDGPCGVKAAISGGVPVFYAQVGTCNGRGPDIPGYDSLWKYTGTAQGSDWQKIRAPGGVGGFGLFDVDPSNPNRLIASHLSPSGVRMVISTDGGSTWTGIPALDTLMTGGGIFRYRTQRGPTDFTRFDGYPQPTLVAFDPYDQKIIVAGGADSGLFYSLDSGANWRTITNNSGGAANPLIPRPRFAHFKHEGNNINIYVGTQGRGVWRIRLSNPT